MLLALFLVEYPLILRAWKSNQFRAWSRLIWPYDPSAADPVIRTLLRRFSCFIWNSISVQSEANPLKGTSENFGSFTRVLFESSKLIWCSWQSFARIHHERWFSRVATFHPFFRAYFIVKTVERGNSPLLHAADCRMCSWCGNSENWSH